jgi:hypothetical protein
MRKHKTVAALQGKKMKAVSLAGQDLESRDEVELLSFLDKTQ